MIKNNTFIEEKDNAEQNIHNTVIAGRQGGIIIKTREKNNETPMGVKNAIVFKGEKNVQIKESNNNNIMIEQQHGERKSLIEKIKDWFSSWSCSCDCKSCIDNESEMNLELNVNEPQNITPGEW